MRVIERLYDCLAWYPWVSSIFRDYIEGNLKERFPMQPSRQRSLSIILNGPSLEKSLKHLNREKTDVCMVNYAVLTELYEKIRPEYICLASSNFFVLNKKIYNFYKRIEEINPEQIIFYPSYVKTASLNRKKIRFKRIYTTDKLYDISKYSVKLLEKNLLAPFFINVGIMALYAGIQMGYKKINLYGADFSYFKSYSVNDDLKVEIEDSHFYGKRRLILPNNMHMELQNLQQAYSQFYIIKRYAEAEHVKIVNMSDESMLDCFERYKHG